jgi:DNA-binding CsgD family transcriptional regulator
LSIHEDRPLSDRETEILQLAADGRPRDEIAEALSIAPGTVRTHLAHIYAKLGVHDRSAAVARGMRMGLIT